MGSLLRKSENLHAIVDMGSNGIRLSISDLSPPTTRIMPTVFQDRADISLYDAQFQSGDGVRGPIPDKVIQNVIALLLRFKKTCVDFEVPEKNIRILATEATRTAPNSTVYRQRLKDATGWEIRMLSKEEEGRIGAMGVASSFASVAGLVMDLGGGSIQITWMMTQNGVVKTSPSVSFPYGAAALARRLEEARRQGSMAVDAIVKEVQANFKHAEEDLSIPPELTRLADENGGFDLYVSGGGFRGWGYLLMSQSKVNPYPVPIINGFKATWADFDDTIAVQEILATASAEKAKIFRISKHRASQVPAVAFLVKVLSTELPLIQGINFCQGGVREGFVFDSLSPEDRAQDPLVVATLPYASESSEALGEILYHALPPPQTRSSGSGPPPSFSPRLCRAVANVMYAHASFSKESRTAAALRCTTTGFLTPVHGISHSDRVLLALVLSDRWAGDLSESDLPFRLRLRQVVSIQEAWWCRYLGRVAALVGDVYPAGWVREPRIDFEAVVVGAKGKKGLKEILELTVKDDGGAFTDLEILRDKVEKIEKIGKKKHWIKAAERVGVEQLGDDYGLKVHVRFDAVQ